MIEMSSDVSATHRFAEHRVTEDDQESAIDGRFP